MWIWTVIGVKSVFVSAGVEAIHGTVSVLLWAFPGGFHIGNMKYPPLIVDIAIRTKGEVVCCMVGVGGIDAVHDSNPNVRLVVAIGVLQEDEIGS